MTIDNKKMMGMLVGGVLLGAVISTGIFMAQKKKQAIDISPALGTPLLKVDGKVYSTAELPGDSAMEYYMLENNIFTAKQNFANQVAIRIALAKDAQKQVDAKSLPKLNEVLPGGKVSETEAKQYYDSLIAQMGKTVFGGQSFEQVRGQLISRMEQQKLASIVNTKVQELQTGGRIQFLLAPPKAPSVSLNIAQYPARGNLNSTVTLVEVADYLCPHCRESEPAIENLYKEFGTKVKFVYVSYPLAPNGLSGTLSRGAFCASKQGNEQFWKFHDAAFQVPWDKNQVPKGEEPTAYYNKVAGTIAQSVGLNNNDFSTCLSSAAAQDYVKNTQDIFNESKGFQGTPTFYLNNQLVQVNPEQLESTLRAALTKIN